MNYHPPILRPLYLQALQAALAAGSVRYARQAALEWLAIYPGDLAVGLAYAQALAQDRRPEQALTILRGLLRADPEYREAAASRLALERPAGPAETAQAQYFALTGQGDRPSWGKPVWLARQAIAGYDPGRADQAAGVEALVEQAVQAAPDEALAAATRLHWLALAPGCGLSQRLAAAEAYARRWPDCLPISLRLAEWRIQSGQDAEGVALLHQSAARDVGGQTARRLWGAQHPYRALWPDPLEARLPGPLPGEVAAALGWNRLPAGAIRPAGPLEAPPDPTATRPAALLRRIWDPIQPGGMDAPAPTPTPTPSEPAAAAPRRPEAAPPKSLDPALQAAAQALERAARRWHAPGVTRLDGRYPVYIVFSLHHRLAQVYGPPAAARIESEMSALAETVGRAARWGARAILADDPASLAPLGLAPLHSGDPWEIKLFLADLDAALAGHSERLGALLIVGGPEIVPFHHLPNPVDDQDVDVPSDNPYAARDENYFLPAWPVGRLPGGAGSDAGLLLGQLSRIRASHAARQAPPGGAAQTWRWLRGLLSGQWRRLRRARPFGYTAAIWQPAAGLVFAPIGRARRLHISPPLGLDGSPNGPLNGLTRPQPQGLAGQVPDLSGRLAYFNLHGLIDAPEWYGQRDPLDASDAPDYPVALRPQDVAAARPAPLVVFSEACYGLHIQDRPVDQTIALRFLEAGALAVAGCTCMAYGSIGAPLTAADLLGHTFWRGLQKGLPAGEALRQAKLQLAGEMSKRQGYLDGEDQKTLISFVLYGDPLAQAAPDLRQAKSVQTAAQEALELHMVCDKALPQDGPDPALTPEMLASVRRVVARYLPGMADAHLTYVQARPTCTGQGHSCPASRINSPGKPGGGLPRPRIPARRSPPDRLPGLVTLSKQVCRADGVHPRIARLTFDGRGRLMKLVVSR